MVDTLDPRGPDQRPGATDQRGQQTAPPAVGQTGTDHSDDARAARTNASNVAPSESGVNGIAPVTTPVTNTTGGAPYATPAAAQASTIRPYDPMEPGDDLRIQLTGLKVQAATSGTGSTYVPNSGGQAGGGAESISAPETRIVNTPSGPQEVIVNNDNADQGTTYDAQSTAALRQSINDQNSADFNDPRRGF